MDPHTHIDMSLGDYATRDGYREATTAAVCGGTTTVVDFAIPRPMETPLQAVQLRRSAAQHGVCDAALHACVVACEDTVPDQLRQMVDLGVRTVKLPPLLHELGEDHRNLGMATDTAPTRAASSPAGPAL